MTYKEEVLAILRSHPEEERNDRLKALAGGRPYRSVLDVLYPQLRDACYIRVQYANRPDSVADTVNRAIEAIRGRTNARGMYGESAICCAETTRKPGYGCIER